MKPMEKICETCIYCKKVERWSGGRRGHKSTEYRCFGACDGDIYFIVEPDGTCDSWWEGEKEEKK